jgi:16S rRNA (guanine527-N7)-methyltransferase
LTAPAEVAKKAGVGGGQIPNDIKQAAAAFGADLEGSLGVALARFLELLLSTNRSFNLTAITDLDAAWPRHVLDSLSLLPSLSADPALQHIVDVGSGGGLPGLPLALALPGRSFTLLEATGKKATFLAEVSRELGLSNVTVVNERAEVFGQGAGRTRFDAATARALSRMPVLLELTLPLLRVGGVCLALKGEQAQAEIDEAQRALALLGGEVREARRTPTGTIVIVDKLRPTPARYPRRPGEPKRSPLV